MFHVTFLKCTFTKHKVSVMCSYGGTYWYMHLISLAGFVLDVPVVLPSELVLIPGQQEKRCISTDQKIDMCDNRCL